MITRYKICFNNNSKVYFETGIKNDKKLIENLEDREKQLILLRYYKGQTQSEVAKVLGITQVQVSRIEKKVLNSMRLKLVI